MDSLQIRLTPELIRRVDKLVDNGIYSNRNEAIRDAVRRMALEYEVLSNTRKIRDKITPLLKGKSGKNIIREVREEDDS